MHPIICKIGPFNLYSYGLMLALAFMACVTLATREAKKQNIAAEAIFNFSFLVFICGILGARIFYVVENLTYYARHPLEMIMLQNGGLSWFGGLILGAASGIIYIKKKKLSVYKILDLLMPFVALAQAIGRIGCLLNGCCFGKDPKFGLYFLVHDAVLIPTQLYSSLLLLVIYVILRARQKRPRIGGEIFYLYLLLYSIKRFFIEFWRADNPIVFAGLTLFQIISIIVFCIAVISLVRIKKSSLRRIS